MALLYVYIVFVGCMMGSFLNVCIYRIPREESIVKPPSHCTACNTRLGPPDLIPVFSYLILRGRCRHCGARISPRYLLIELLTGGIYGLLFYRFGVTADFLAAAFLMTVLTAVFFIDLEHKIIPNGLVLTGLVGAIPLFIYNIFYPVEIFMDRLWWNPVAGGAGGFLFLFAVALLGMLIFRTDDAMGMGDVKIFAPIGLFLGWRMTLVALIISIFAAGFGSLVLLLTRLKKRKDTIPFGPFIVAGVLITLLWGKNILEWYLGVG